MNLYDELVLIYIKVSLNSAILAFIYFFFLFACRVCFSSGLVRSIGPILLLLAHH